MANPRPDAMGGGRQPAVSVVMPIYNAQPYLREALDSVICQTLEDIEVVCVNDGSADSSLEIIQEYAAKDPRIVVSDGPNGGYGKAMNRGFDRASGRYIGILEPDDKLLPDMFETLVEIADRDRLDFIRADFNRFTTDAEGRDSYKLQTICPGRERLYGKVLDPQEDLDLYNVRMQNWTGIYRTSFIRGHGIRLHESPGARFQDNGLWFQTYCWAERIEYLDRPFYCHRDDNPNSSTNRSDLTFAMLDEWAWIREYLHRYPQKEEKLIGVYQCRKFHNCNFAFSKLSDELQPSFLERYSREMREARDAGELDMSLFSRDESRHLELLMSDPDAYLAGYREDRAKRERYGDPPKGAVQLFAYYVKTEGVGGALDHLGRRLGRMLGR